LSQLAEKSKQLFPDAASFSGLQSGEQIQVLKALEKGRFFRTVRTHTAMGMFAPPDHGGNYDQTGWKLIGYDNAMNFKPPFGYYDAKRS
jgi:Gluconate 2-dehydrogenase subunit 3